MPFLARWADGSARSGPQHSDACGQTRRGLGAGGWRLEAGSWKLEAGSWKLEAGSKEGNDSPPRHTKPSEPTLWRVVSLVSGSGLQPQASSRLLHRSLQRVAGTFAFAPCHKRPDARASAP